MNYIKRLIISLLSIILIITPSLSLAFATDEWDKKYKYDKGGVVVAGTKGNLISNVKIHPTATKIGKFIGKGGHNALIGLALTEMLGKTVDYVLDPKNNQVVVKSDGYRWLAYNTLMEDTYFDTKEQAGEFNCNYAYQLHLSYFRKITDDIYEVICSNDGSAWIVDRVKDDRKEKLISLEEVAKKLKEMAKQGNKQAQKLLEELVKEMGKNKELEKDLDKNAKDKKKEQDNCIKRALRLDPLTLLCIPDWEKDKDDEPEPKEPNQPNNPNHNDGDKDCDKCTILREIERNTQQTAQNTEQMVENTQEIKESTKSIKDKFDGLLDWLKDDNIDKQDGQVDVQDLAKDLKIDENRIRLSQNQCPPPKQITVNVGLVTQTYEYSYQPMCDFFAKLRPFVIATASLSAILIIGGIRRG